MSLNELFDNIKVSDFPSLPGPLVTIDSESSLFDAISLLDEKRILGAPVLRHGVPVGPHGQCESPKTSTEKQQTVSFLLLDVSYLSCTGISNLA